MGAENACKCSFSVQNILTFCINQFCTRVLNAVSVIFFKSSLNIIVHFIECNLTDSDEILETLFLTRCLNLLQISWRLASLLQNHLRKKCRSLCTVIVKCVQSKVMAAFLDTKINMMHSFNLHIFWWVYVIYVAGQFLWIVWKSRRWFLCSKCLNWHKWEIKNQLYTRVMPVY